MRTVRESGPRPGRISAGLILVWLGVSGCGNDSGADPNAAAVPVGDDGKTIAATKDLAGGLTDSL